MAEFPDSAPTSDPIRLVDLLDIDRAPDRIVAWRSDGQGGDRSVDWGGFRASVALLRDRIAALPSGPVALATSDAFSFGVGLFASWYAGRVAVCPPNTQPGSLSALADLVIATVTDEAVVVPGRPVLSLGFDDEEALPPSVSFGSLSNDAPAIELFTSGTTV